MKPLFLRAAALAITALLLFPAAALATGASTESVVSGSSIGPARYSRVPSAFRPVGYVGEGVTINTLDRYSWMGVWCYSLTVKGYYHADGFRIDNYGGVFALTSTNGLVGWNVSSTSASWAMAMPSGGTAVANGVFTHGILSPWGNLTIQTVTDLVSSVVRA